VQSRASADLPPELATKLEAAVRRIVQIAAPQLIILFGSYAEGRAGEGSDVDLLVVAETQERVHLTVDLLTAVEPLLAPTPCDILVRTPARWELGRRTPGFVSRDADLRGVRLYEAV